MQEKVRKWITEQKKADWAILALPDSISEVAGQIAGLQAIIPQTYAIKKEIERKSYRKRMFETELSNAHAYVDATKNIIPAQDIERFYAQRNIRAIIEDGQDSEAINTATRATIRNQAESHNVIIRNIIMQAVDANDMADCQALTQQASDQVLIRWGIILPLYVGINTADTILISKIDDAITVVTEPALIDNLEALKIEVENRFTYRDDMFQASINQPLYRHDEYHYIYWLLYEFGLILDYEGLTLSQAIACLAYAIGYMDEYDSLYPGYYDAMDGFDAWIGSLLLQCAATNETDW